MFKRKIYPIVTWIQRQKRFFPNWEVEKILHVPLRKLLEPGNYRRYRLRMNISGGAEPSKSSRDYPAFQFEYNSDTEILWGATYRITAVFLEYVFGFKPPDLQTLPLIEGSLEQSYLTGQK